MTDRESAIVTEKLLLTVFNAQLCQTLSRYGLEAAESQIQFTEDCAKNAAVRLAVWLTATEPSVTSVSCPATWWDAFKIRWFPQWLLRRYPARFNVHQWTRRLVFPEIPPPMQERYRIYEWCNYETTELLRTVR